MTDDGQTGLGDFGPGPADTGGDDRPDEEAEAIAGRSGDDAQAVVDPQRDSLPDADGTVEIAVTQVDYTIVGSGREERPIVHVFGRTPENELEHVRVRGFRPYFYAPTDTLDDATLDRDAITGFEEGYESLRGEELTKIYGRTPRDVGAMRDEFEHFEADILFPNRLLIDKDIRGGVRVPARRESAGGPITVHHEELEPVDVDADPRVCMLDIEVDDRRGFPEDGEEPILCLTTHDSYRDEYVAWLYEAPAFDGTVPDSLPDYEQIGDDSTVDVRSFDSEPAMLEAVISYVEERDPDLLSGWNCLPADSEVQMADGRTKAIAEVKVGDEVVGSEDRSTTVAEVTNTWQSEKEVLEFQLADGTSLRSSEEHRIMVGDEESVEWTEAADVETGDYVLKPRQLNVEDPVVPRLSELVPDENQQFEDEATVDTFKRRLPYGAVTDLADEFGLATGSMYNRNPDVWAPERCERASQMYDIPVPDGGRVYRRNGSALDRELTEREAYLAGLVLTDGTMSRSDGIRFYNTREELHEQFTEDPHLEPDGKGCYKQNVLDYARMHAFNGLGIPFGDKNDAEIDLSPVYGMPEEYVSRFLAGVIDGDGSVSSSVTVAAENESLGDWYVRLFKRLGVYAERNGNVVRVPDAERDIATLRERVAPHMNHTEKAAEVRSLSGGKSGRTEDIPYALFEAETGSDAKRIGRDTHRRGISLKRHETDVEEWENYVFVEVDSVETIGVETTYDIETTTSNFVAEECLVHNCDDFDIPYLFDRLEEIGPASDEDLSVDRFSRVNEVWRSGWGGPDVKGRVVFDLLYAYKRTQYTELESYRLDAVGEMELDVGKERYPGDIGDLWEDDPERLLEYNVRDVELCVEINHEQDVIPFWQDVASFIGCKLEDAPTPGDAVDMYVLHEAHGEFVLPSKGQQESEEFEGGAVFDPITGVREMVSVLDLKSLYPMSMVTINASPETKVDPDVYDGETYQTPTGIHFRKEPDGIIREMVDALLAEREEKKELRNQYDPNTEPYERYDRQQGAVKVIMNCFTPDTEVLTPEGVRNIRDLAVGDEVYSLDPDSMEMEVKPVTETHEYPDYRGELVDIETSTIDFRVTPNHRMLVRKNETNGITWDEADYRFVEAGELDDATNYELPHDWTVDHGEDIDRIDLTELVEGDYEVWVRPEVHGHTFAAEIGYHPDKVPKNDRGEEGYVFSAEEFENHREYIEDVAEQTYIHAEPNRKWIPRTYDADDFLALVAWYVTEGNVYTSEEKQFGDNLRGSATTVKIAQNRAVTDGGVSDHAAIGDLLDDMGLDYYVDERSYQFTSKLLGDLFERLCGDDSHHKRLPELVFGCSRRQKRRFLDVLIDGDGDRQPNSWRYTTSSERLRDDVLRLCTHLGLTASYNRDSGSWRIYCTEGGKNTLRMNRSGGRSTAEDGVYCVTVQDNHTLLAGRNGKFQFVGQSLYGVFGWDRFRLYDREMSAGVTSTNREVIRFTEETVDEMGRKVTYGDSVTGDRPIVVRDPSGIVRIRPIEDLFEDAIADDEPPLLTADGGVDSRSSQKQYRRIDGWEALSLSEDGTAEWKPITRVVRHETDKPVVTLQHKFGESTTTEDHSYVVDRDGEFVESPPGDVEEPLRIPDLPSVDTLESIDVYEVLDGYTREYEDGRSVGDENATTKTKRVHADEDRVWFGHEHHGDLDKTVTVHRHVDLTSEDGEALVRLLAAYVSEGSASTVETTEGRFGASISQDRTDWLDGLQSDYYRLFENTTASIIASDTGDDRTVTYDTADGEREVTYSDGSSKLQMMNELAAVFFREFAGQTSRGKRIPSFVFHLPENLQDLFLDVLIEGDGSREFPRYSEEYAERNFDFETTSRRLAAGLSTLLTQRGRKHSLKYRDSKDSYTIRTCDFYRSGRDPVVKERDNDGFVYDLSVEDNENFVDGVGGIVLHNTDSVMIELGDEITKEEAIDTSFDIEEAINDSYDEFTREELNAEDHRFQIEFEKLYRRFFQAGKKKRYAGHIVWKEGKDVDDIDITGFEYKRSDIAPITKRVQREVIEMIVTGEDIEDVKAYVSDVIEDFEAGNVSLDDVGIPGGIGKRLDAYDTDTAQVRGAKYANLLLGTNFGRGSKPKRLYLEKNGIHPDYFERIDDDIADDPLFESFKRDVSAGDGVICFEYADQVPDELQIDWEKMLDKTLKGPIARVLEALDVSWEEVKTGQEQTGLGSFM